MYILDLIEEKKLIIDLRSYSDSTEGSLTIPSYPLRKNTQKFNPLLERIQDHDEAWEWLTYHIIQYDWDYRKRICTKCTLETQEKLKCQKINDFRVVDGIKIQKTYCSKLKKSRSSKFKNHIKHVFTMNPLLKTTL